MHVRGDEENFAEIGDAWIFVGNRTKHKLVFAHHLGNRTVSGATRFMRKLASATYPTQKFQLTTDGLRAYSLGNRKRLGHQGERVDYALIEDRFDIPEDHGVMVLPV